MAGGDIISLPAMALQSAPASTAPRVEACRNFLFGVCNYPDCKFSHPVGDDQAAAKEAMAPPAPPAGMCHFLSAKKGRLRYCKNHARPNAEDKMCSAHTAEALDKARKASLQDRMAKHGEQSVSERSKRRWKHLVGTEAPSGGAAQKEAALVIPGHNRAHGMSQRISASQHRMANPLSARRNKPPPPLDPAAVFAAPGRPLMVDLGAARGKFVAELAASEAWGDVLNFVGLELRGELVEHAMEALHASRPGPTNLTFVAGAVSYPPSADPNAATPQYLNTLTP